MLWFNKFTSGITKPLPDDAQFTAVSPDKDQNGDYQLCCPPTDTSPPFNASEEGLDTISSTAPNMQLVDGNLIFDSLIYKTQTQTHQTQLLQVQ